VLSLVSSLEKRENTRVKHKLEQFNQSLKKVLGQILLKRYPEELTVTVTDVLLDPSFQHGRVWVRCSPELLIRLNKQHGEIQGEIKFYLKSRYTPKLEFLADDEYVEHLDQLFETTNRQ